MSQALYRKWRPRDWEQVIGQQHIVQTLRNAVAHDQVRHAYLFAGPRGTGKTTTARLLAKAVNCLAEDPAARPCNQCANCTSINEGRFLDLIEIDAASNTSVDDVRDLRDKINFSPSQGKYKVYIIDEVHMLSTAAFNALLKTLEEPPPHAIFILATTEVHKIPATVLSRCQRHEFRRIPVPEIVTLLEQMAASEKLKVEPAALTLIARQATGSMRDAISLLDQLSSVGKKITLDMAQDALGTAASQAVIALVDAIQVRDAAAGLSLIHQTLDAGADPRQFARQVVDYLRNLMLVRMGGAAQVDATQEQREVLSRQALAFETPHLLAVLRAFNSAAADLRGSWQPALLLELAFADSIAPEAVSAVLAESPAPAPSVPPAAGQQPALEKHAPRSKHEEATPEITKPADQSTVPAREKNRGDVSSRPAEEKTGPAAKPAGDAGADVASSFRQVLQNWTRIKAAVKKARPNTVGLLNSCQPLGIKDGALLLGFVNDLMKSKMEMGNNVAVTETALTEVLGQRLSVRCVVSGGKSGKLPEDIPIEDEGMVAAALRDLGGEVVDFHE
jgi:DNA polymerase-3 subunit gamma/tau